MKFLTPPLHPWLLSLIAALIVPAMEAGAFDVRVRSTTLMEGRDKPAIILVPDDRVNSISMRLQRDDGAAVSRSGGPFNAGQEVVWEWSQPVGRQSYTGTLTVVYGDGQEGSMSPQFTIEVLGALKVEVPREQVNMDAHKVYRDRAATLERALADHLRDLGHKVIGTHPRERPLDGELVRRFSEVCQAVQDFLPMKNQHRGPSC